MVLDIIRADILNSSCVVFFRASKGLRVGKSVEIHPALSAHQYIARANNVNNTESQ